MSTSPKIVKVDLGMLSKNHRTSPNKKYANAGNHLIKQFSFSEKVQTDNPSQESSNKGVSPSLLAKKLFNSPTSKHKNHQTTKHTKGSSKSKVDKICQKYRNFNPNYEQVDEKDHFFKKSIEKLKTSFFKNDRDSKQSTKKILKEIGKYAEHRQQSYLLKGSTKSKPLEAKYANIPVQLYGFNSNKGQNKTQKERQQLQKGTYVNFQQAHELALLNNNNDLANIDYKSSNVQYFSAQQRASHKKQSYLMNQEAFQQNQPQQIGEREIDIICEIFQYCNKIDESDKFTRQDLNDLIEHFKRRYFIIVTQNTESDQIMLHMRFQNLLNEFEEDLKVIFYRKQDHNIYDTLYYLKQTNHLQLVCEDYYQVKKILQL